MNTKNRQTAKSAGKREWACHESVALVLRLIGWEDTRDWFSGPITERGEETQSDLQLLSTLSRKLLWHDGVGFVLSQNCFMSFSARLRFKTIFHHQFCSFLKLFSFQIHANTAECKKRRKFNAKNECKALCGVFWRNVITKEFKLVFIRLRDVLLRTTSS